MKAIGYAFLVCSVFLVSACKKTTPTVDVNFHGRVTYQCDSSPVMGMVVDIIGYFHGNPNYNDYLGSPTTDDNGNYYLRGSVDKNADVMYYSVETTSKMNPKPAYFFDIGDSYKLYYPTSQNEDNITMDVSMPVWQIINFHIKNVNPYDGSDMFYGASNFFGGNYTLQLSGMTIDTTVVGKAIKRNPFHYEYSFKKNGITTFVEDSIPVTCFDIPAVDIFY